MKFTHISQPNTIPPAVRIEKDGMRYYEVDGNNTYPSVTTILDTFDDEARRRWHAKLRREGKDPAQVEEENLQTGTDFHAAIERYLSNWKPYPTKNVEPLFNAIKPTLDKIDGIMALEVPIFSNKLKAAGTVDCIASIEGMTMVIDFKTANTMQTIDSPRMRHYFAQAAAYRTMWNEHMSPSMNVGEYLAIIMVSKDKFEANMFVAHHAKYLELFHKQYEAWIKKHG